MKNKWFVSAAEKNSGFEHLADFTVTIEGLNNEKLNGIDLLFVKNKLDFFSKFRFSNFTIVTDIEISPEKQGLFILENLGETFLSRIGHDIINLFVPLEHYDYLDENIISERIKQGIRFGKQVNIIGHLIQNTKLLNSSFYDFDNFILTIENVCRKMGIAVKIDNTAEHRIDSIPDYVIMNTVIDEILLNWKMHGNGNYTIEIISDKKMVFKNTFDGKLNFERPKAQLRCPFMKKNTGKGAGLGLFIVSLSSVKGGFDWDISVKENCFSLSLLF